MKWKSRQYLKVIHLDNLMIGVVAGWFRIDIKIINVKVTFGFSDIFNGWTRVDLWRLMNELKVYYMEEFKDKSTKMRK